MTFRSHALITLTCVAALAATTLPFAQTASADAGMGSGSGASGGTNASAPGDRRANRTPDEHGVIGRKVRDVVAERRVGRRLGSLDPRLIRLADDADAYLDDDGKLFYADVSMSPPAVGEPVPSSPVSTPAQVGTPAESPVVAEGVTPASGSAFALNSRPGSPHTIYLDFDGETVANSAWNSGRANPKTVPAWDLDGFPSTFNATEEQTIRNVWQAVAEDWAPFDVNVTTQRPASDDAFFRNSPTDNVFGAIAVVTPDKWTCTGCGGVAYVDIFDPYAPASMYYQYAWVFPTTGWTATSIANVISHEVGHNFGLSHDGINTTEYYGGTGSWGPIMGNPGRTYVQWSKGEYAGATNVEDDLALIATYAPVLADTSTSLANAVQIGSTGLTQITSDDLITSASDIDYYAVDVTNGYLRAVFGRSLYANLYPRISLLNSAGTELSAIGVFSGTSSVLYSGSIANGRYYLKTEAAADSASPGFTTYGSLGYYNWTVTRADTPTVTSISLSAFGDRSFSGSWVGGSQSTEPLTYVVTLCTASSCGTPTQTTATSAILTAPTSTGQYYLKVSAFNRFGLTSAELSSPYATVLSKPVAPQATKVRFEEAIDTVRVEWANGQEFAPVTVTGHTITVRNRSTGAQVSAAVTGASGATAVAVPATWDGIWIDVYIVSNTSQASPWNVSDASVSSLYLGRTTMSAPATGASSTRAPAPPAPNAAGTRTGATGA